MRNLKTHCLRGHEYTKENSGYFRNGARYCKECKRVLGNVRQRKMTVWWRTQGRSASDLIYLERM